jgi:hypothetical protein
MINTLRNLFGLQPWRTHEEVWADALSYHAQQGLLHCIFTTTGSFARDPQFLSRWGWQVRALRDNLYPPRTPTDQVLQRWVKSNPSVNRVAHLLTETDLGFELFAATLHADPEVLGLHYDIADHNGSMLRLNCASAVPAVAGPVGAAVVAAERLAALARTGARPIVGACLQVDPNLYANAGKSGAPAMVVLSFDPAVPPAQLAEVAQMLADLKTTDTQNSVLLAAAAAPRAGDKFWFYHRRFRIPPELTEGRLVYAADLWVHRAALPGEHLSPHAAPFLPLLAQPGDLGGVELIPHDLLSAYFPLQQTGLFRAAS